jgi:hypothetical protein
VIVISPDYSSEILVLQREIISINTRLDWIDDLEYRVTAFESQVTANTKTILDIRTA